MKILIINLARAADRRNFMREQLDALQMDYAFVPSTDYREMREEDFRAQCDPRVLTGDAYLKGVFAASLSHLTAYKTILAEGLDYALICEDDAVFPPNIAEILQQLEQKMRPDEIVLLSYYSHTHSALALSNHKPLPITNALALLSPTAIDQVASAMAYIVPKAVAARLIAVLMPVNHVPDHWGNFYQKGGFQHLRCLYPQVMADAPFASIVEYPATQTLSFKLKQCLRNLPIPGLRSYLQKSTQQKTQQKHQAVIVDVPPFSQHHQDAA